MTFDDAVLLGHVIQLVEPSRAIIQQTLFAVILVAKDHVKIDKDILDLNYKKR